MVLSAANICAFGWKARDFALKGVDGKTYSLADVRGPMGTLVVFICNHCPYVKASIDRIVAEAKALRELGIGTIAVMPNDTNVYPQDSFDNMKAFSARHGFTFPYVIDTTQQVAHAYDAQCTPDFFGFKCARRTAVSRAARCFAHAANAKCAPRPVRSDEAGGRDGPRT
jgi:peroxiredoxin